MRVGHIQFFTKRRSVFELADEQLQIFMPNRRNIFHQYYLVIASSPVYSDVALLSIAMIAACVGHQLVIDIFVSTLNRPTTIEMI